MLKIENNRFAESKAHFLVTIVTGNEIPEYSESHLRKETQRYMDKDNINGTVQFIPVESWAVVMCDTMNNRPETKIEEYEKDCQYVVNLFCDKENKNLNSFKSALHKICDRVPKGARIAFKYKEVSKISDDWNRVQSVIRSILCDFDVEICKR